MMIGNSDADWEQLRECGFDAIIWQQGDDYGRADTRKLTFRFTDGVTAHDDLVSNKDQTEYASIVILSEWELHGVKNVWVTVQSKESIIHIRMQDRNQPLTLTKNY